MAAPMEKCGPCSLSKYFEGSCGPCSKFPSEKEIILLRDCNKEITGHLRACKLSKLVRNEGELIAQRAGIWKWSKETDIATNVCPAHRYTYGIGWRAGVRCGFALHPPESSSRPQRGMSAKMCELAQLRWGYLCRVGTGICRQCLDVVSPNYTVSTCVTKDLDGTAVNAQDMPSPKFQDTNKKSNSKNCEPAGASNVEDLGAAVGESEKTVDPQMLKVKLDPCEIKRVACSEDEEDSQSQLMSQGSNWSVDCAELSLPKANQVMKSLKVSPLRSQLRTDILEAKPSTVRYYKRKAEESVHSLLDMIAPSQGKMLKKDVISPWDNKNRETDLIDTLSKLYLDTVDNSLKSQILAVMSKKMTKLELQKKLPGLTMYRIDQARAIHNKATCHGLEIKEKTKYHRHKMDKSKLQHAVGFFFDPAFMQLVSYGTTELTLDSGETITIPDVIRTSCHSRIVELYLSYCQDTGFAPLGKSTLYQILNACAAKKRTNLHGLDNIAADGIDAFESLLNITKQLTTGSHLSTEQQDDLIKSITEAKLYLKTDYKVHIEKESICADHCLSWLLSDPDNGQFCRACDHVHTLTCDRCELLRMVEKKLEDAIVKMDNTDDKEDILKSFSDAISNIHGWKSHIIRTVNQDMFRLQVLENLKRFESVVVMDWAMKFLPMRHREKQTDWFGQRGKHWHVSVLIYRDENGEIGHRTYTHVMENVKQDWYAVASLLEHLLLTVKEQLPHVTDIYLRSDNAGCYHCGHLWLSIPTISERTGLRIKQYSYSEAQAGKSYCDSKIAHMRTKMRSYVSNGHDILTADDMKTAIDHGLGVAGCQVAHVEIDTQYHILKNHTIKNVSLFNDVIYTHYGEVVLKKAFSIGDGRKMSKDEFSKCSAGSSFQDKFGCLVLREFSPPYKVKGKINISKNQQKDDNVTVQFSNVEEPLSPSAENESSYNCPIPGCVKLYSSYKLLDRHLMVGKHDIRLQRESTYDIIKKQWAELCNSVVVVIGKSDPKNPEADSHSVQTTVPMGWALKKVRKVTRFSPSVKKFLEEKFEEGVKTGKKCLPQDVANEMKRKTDSEGNRIFPASECLNTTQIISFFSRLASKRSDTCDETDIRANESSVTASVLISEL